jgi:hypothetical protein
VRPEMTKFKIFKEEIFILWELHSKILVGDKNHVSIPEILAEFGCNCFHPKNVGVGIVLIIKP